MRQFYTAAVQFKFNRRFRESRLLDGVDVLANETQIVAQMALIASTLRFTPMCSCARCTLLKVLNLRMQITGAARQGVPNARTNLMADVVARGVRVPAAHSWNTMQKFVGRLFSLIVTSANFDVVKIMTNCRPIDQTHVFATWTCRH